MVEQLSRDALVQPAQPEPGIIPTLTTEQLKVQMNEAARMAALNDLARKLAVSALQ